MRLEEYSEELERDWICGVESSSAKINVLGEDVARVIRSAAARGDEAVLVSARKG